MARKYFGTDGIRGLANRAPMTSEVALLVGMAAGKLFSNGGGRPHRVVIGKDTRLSGYMIESALMSGFTAVGMDVFLLGPMPTPAVAMLTRSLRADLGVMISASHNPFEDNGIKLFDPEGYKISDEAEAEIEALMDAGPEKLLVPAGQIGRAKRIDSAQERYIEFAKRTLPRDIRLNNLRVVIDCANGAAYQVAPEVLWELGAEVIKIGVEPNGRNINEACGSMHPEHAAARVRELRADAGIALDGDADRCVMVDERGQVVDGDALLALLADDAAERGVLRGGSIVATVMSNLGLEQALERRGIGLVRTAVGDRYVVEAMRAGGYNLGGEASGHVVLLDHNTTGDGLISALKVLAILRRRGKPLSQLCADFQRFPQVLVSVQVAEKKPIDALPELAAAVKRVEASLGRRGRVLIRYSGTEPKARVMVEGEDEAQVREYAEELAGRLQRSVGGRA
jgi:phosphoglucosamine mutase